MVRKIALLAALLLTLPAAAQEGAKAIVRTYSVKKDASSLTYKLKHKLHEVVGTAKPSDGIVSRIPGPGEGSLGGLCLGSKAFPSDDFHTLLARPCSALLCAAPDGTLGS